MTTEGPICPIAGDSEGMLVCLEDETRVVIASES